jgi:SAM-dependent methyltransferase
LIDEGRMLYWNPNTLVLPLGGGLLRLFQVSARRNVVTTLPFLELIDRCSGGCPAETVRAVYNQLGDRMRLTDATAFTLWDNAFRNSDMYEPVAGPQAVDAMPWDDALELLTECGILSRGWPPVQDFPKRGFADRHRGSFHGRVASESLFNRTNPASWWTGQKFTPACTDLRPTPYRFIEQHFLDIYFAENAAGLNILDVGCGTGYFTARMASYAKSVVGMDHNPDHLAVAQRTYPKEIHANLDFFEGDMIDLVKSHERIKTGRFDRVILIDTFLFLFENTYQTQLLERRDDILQNLARLVAPGGLLLIMDPHPLWFTPWLGSETHPIGVVTEYRHRRFKVSPSLEEVSTVLYKNSLRIRRILEPDIDPAFADIDPQACAWMHEAPQWWFLEVEIATQEAE